MIAQVTFPTYAKIQNDLDRLKRAFLQVLKLVGLFSFFVAGFIFLFATPFTRIFLGEKWLPMVPAMKILVIAGLLRALTATTGSVFYALGQPKIETRWELIHLLFLVVLIYPLALKWGISGVATAVLISTLVSTLGFFAEVRRLIK